VSQNIERIGRYRVDDRFEWLGLGRGSYESHESWAADKVSELVESPDETLREWRRLDGRIENHVIQDRLGNVRLIPTDVDYLSSVRLSVFTPQEDERLAILDEWPLALLTDGIEQPFRASNRRLLPGHVLVAEHLFMPNDEPIELPEESYLALPYTGSVKDSDEFDSGQVLLQ
jgi:hypothetical protein